MKETSPTELYEKPTVEIINIEPEGIIAASGETGSKACNYSDGDDIQLDSWY